MHGFVCPESDELERLLTGQLHEQRSGDLTEHIETCLACQARLEDVARRMNETAAVRVAGPVSAGVPPAVVERLSRKLYAELGVPHDLDDSDSPARLAPHVIVDDYEILEEIGRGGMGTVYRARHTRLDKIVALKVLEIGDYDRVFGKKERLARFDREIRSLGRLRHPNIVSALDAGQVTHVHYLAMEYVDGVTLKQLVEDRGPLEIHVACEIIRQAATGLRHALEAGIIHRDIKPSNIMLSRDDAAGQVKILDLGLARFLEDWRESGVQGPTQAGTVLGTLSFMAPEQFGGDPVDTRADIFSLGGTLFWLLTGQTPFPQNGRNLLDQVRIRANQLPPSVRTFRPDLPHNLADLVDSMLAMEPSRRPSTPGAVASGLEQFCQRLDVESIFPVKSVSTVDMETGKARNQLTRPVFDEAVSGSNRSDPSPATNSNQGWGRNWFHRVAIAGFILFPLLVALGIVIHLKTDGGEIVIHCHDPDLVVEIIRNEKSVGQFEIGTLPDRNWFRSGNYEIRLPKSDDDKFQISNNVFELKRGGKEIVTIEIVPPPPKPISEVAGKYVTWEFPDGGRYVKNSDGTWSVYFAVGGKRDLAVNQVSEGDVVPIVVDDPYHGLQFRFGEDVVDVSSNQGKTWAPFYSGKGKWILNQKDKEDISVERHKESKVIPADKLDETEYQLQRRAAELILARGARPIISIGDKRYWLEPRDALPDDPFLIRGLWTGDEYSSLTDEDCRWLGQFASIEILDFHSADEITSQGLDHFRNCLGLRCLALSRYQGKEAIPVIADHFSHLKFFGPQGDVDEWMKAMRGNSAIIGLDFYRTSITDNGAADLTTLKNLRYLDISDTAVGDNGFKQIARMRSLYYLVVSSQVTDEGMRALFENRGLRHLYYPRLDGRQALTAELRAALPDCSLIHSWNPLGLNQMMMGEMGLPLQRWPPPQ